MSLGFRKSFFGYNCEEVTEYITRLNAQNNQTVSALKDKIKTESDNLAKAEEEIKSLNQKINELDENLAFYKSKYDEVKKLSDNIGKLYLVAQTNAKAIMESANSAHDSSKAEIDKNIELLDNTDESLTSLEEKVSALSEEFSKSVSALREELNNIKGLASQSEEAFEKSNENFNTAYNSIV